MLFFITFINVILSFFSLLFISLTLNQLDITLETHAMKKQKHPRAKVTSIRFSGLKLRLVMNFACRKNFCFEGYIGSIKFQKRNTDNYFFFSSSFSYYVSLWTFKQNFWKTIDTKTYGFKWLTLSSSTMEMN